MGDVKKWGGEDFWGLGYEFDPQWLKRLVGLLSRAA